MAKRTEGPSTWCSLTHARALTNTFLGSGPALVLLPACIAGKCLDLIPSSHTLTITTNSTTSARTRGHSMLHSVACLAPPSSKVSRGQASDITPPLLFSPLLFSCPHRRCSFSLIVCASLCLSASVAVWFCLQMTFLAPRSATLSLALDLAALVAWALAAVAWHRHKCFPARVAWMVSVLSQVQEGTRKRGTRTVMGGNRDRQTE